MSEYDENHIFDNRRIFIMILLYETMGLSSTLSIPHLAISHGPFGSLIVYALTLIFIGIPVVYMELIVSQFTSRNCIDVWKIRPCLSHIGYIVFFWQFFMLTYNHLMVTLLVHYLLVSFENPPPYSVCGPWADQHCDILTRNYTLNQYCVKEKLALPMCQDLYKSFPEYQYYTRHLLETKTLGMYLSWPIVISSGVVLLVIYFNCFKMLSSIKWSIYPMTVYPLVGMLVLMMGSLQQKGVVGNIGDALDVQLEEFSRKLEPSSLVHQALHSVGAGAGVFGNLAAAAPFRSPCYANAVMAVLGCLALCVISICVTAMMLCPYAITYGVEPDRVMSSKITFTFIKTPKLLSEYDNGHFWLLLRYSILCVTGISSNVVVLFSMLLTVTHKSDKLKRYPAVVSFFSIFIVFLITLPMLSPFGKQIMNVQFRRTAYLTTTFFAMCEFVVFILTYGFGRFYEDIHFMEGRPPKTFMKVSWVLVIITLVYVFCYEVINNVLTAKTFSDKLGLYILLSCVAPTIIVFIGRLLVAAVRREFKKQFELDPSWGPLNELLKRSRQMFTAHAMTKEYMYRQYHLQAGVMARQQRSNVRSRDRRLPPTLLERCDVLLEQTP